MSESQLAAFGKEEIRNVVDVVAQGLVDKKDQVSVRIREGEQTTVIEVSGAREDIGKLIGKKGVNVGAVRTIVNALSAKHGIRCVVDILE